MLVCYDIENIFDLGVKSKGGNKQFEEYKNKTLNRIKTAITDEVGEQRYYSGVVKTYVQQKLGTLLYVASGNEMKFITCPNAPASADDCIVESVESSKSNTIVVVTSDKELQERVRQVSVGKKLRVFDNKGKLVTKRGSINKTKANTEPLIKPKWLKED